MTDGTEAGTTLVMDIDEASGSSAPRDLAVMNGLLYFKGDDGYAHGGELWVTDGTADGTVMVLDIVPGSNESLPRDPVAFNSELWFSAYTGGTANLWHSDGYRRGRRCWPWAARSTARPHTCAHKATSSTSPHSSAGPMSSYG
ncbi:MAG: hypothetical protein IPN30_09870 [Flavobacteriales bacterium]|nr:hypothetical protein [Flavobacteriales bacterium]